MLKRINKYRSKLKILLQFIDIAYKEQIHNGELKDRKASHFHGGNRFENFQIGCNSYVSFNSIIYNCSIGNYCSIGPNVVIGVGSHPYQYLTTSPNVYLDNQFFSMDEQKNIIDLQFKKCLIKNDVWIGANVYIKNGVTIGNGAIVGAGSVVLKDVLDFEIVAGVPAKKIKMRFTDEIIDLINRLNWWDKSPEELLALKDIIKAPTKENLEIYFYKNKQL